MARSPQQPLLWWVNDLSFDGRPWWEAEGSNGVNFDHPSLLADQRANGTKIFRPGPIYWEILRRHPELPGLRNAARGQSASNLRGDLLKRRLSVLDDRCQGPAFYLISLYAKAWPDLPGDAGSRFEMYLPGFALAAQGQNHGKIRFPNPAVDLLHESADRLGLIASIGSFLADVETRMIGVAGADLAPSAETPPKTERVILWDRLERELARFGLQPALLAFSSIANNKAIAQSFERSLDRFHPEGEKPLPTGRLQPDVLDYFAKIFKLRSCNALARKKINSYFKEFSFEAMIDALNREVGQANHE